MDRAFNGLHKSPRTINTIRQDVASAARALRHHAEALGKLRQQSRVSREAKLVHVDDVKAIAEYCEELERTIVKHFNAAVRKEAAKGKP